MKEKLGPRSFRWMMNLWPCYRGTGARVTYIAPDWKDVRLRLPLNPQTRNYVGSIFGGSLYGAVDPIYMLMLMHLLGPGYVVWDKAASIRFLRPGRTMLYAACRVDDAELDEIRRLLEAEARIDRTYKIALTDAEGTVHAEVDKVIRIRRREPAAGQARAS